MKSRLNSDVRVFTAYLRCFERHGQPAISRRKFWRVYLDMKKPTRDDDEHHSVRFSCYSKKAYVDFGYKCDKLGINRKDVHNYLIKMFITDVVDMTKGNQ